MPANSPTSLPHTLIFVDCENVPKVDLSLLEGRPAHVTLLLGKNQTKLDVQFVAQIKRLHAQVELVILEHSGRNALDITLAYYLGRATARHAEAQFVVVSKDKDYVPVLAHLTSQGIKVARHESLADIPSLSARSRPISPLTAPDLPRPPAHKAPSRKSPPTAKPTPASSTPDRSTRIIARLRDPQNKNRPSKLPALRAHLKTALGKDASDDAVQALIEKLGRDDILSIQADETITYSP